MKAINITPDVYKMVKECSDKGVAAAKYALDRVLEPEKAQVFKEADSDVFWFECKDNPQKHEMDYLKARIIRTLKLTYRDEWKKEVSSKETIKNKADKVKQDLQPASLIDLKLFVRKYMKGYKVSKDYKGKELTDEERTGFFNELGKNYTDGTNKVINEIYGGKKPMFNKKTKMSQEEKEELDKQNREEFEWYFDNLIWLAKPSKEYCDKFKKFSTSNYLKVTADLRSCVCNGIYRYRKLF